MQSKSSHTYTTPSRIPSTPQMDTKGSKDIKEILGVLNQKILALIPSDTRKKKDVANEEGKTEQDVEEGQATQELATNDSTLAQHKNFTYFTLLLIAALTINWKHALLSNAHAPVCKLSKE